MRTLLLTALLLLTGCQYGPLERQENQPQLTDAVVERDIVVTGRSYVVFRENNNGVGGLLCIMEQDVEGWEAPELNDETCIGCQETYTLGLVTTESDCDFTVGATADIAFTPIEFLDVSGVQDSVADWLLENEAESYLNTTWTVRSTDDWEPRMGVWSDETPNPLEGGNGTYECEFDRCAQHYFWYGSGDWYARWWVDLEFE